MEKFINIQNLLENISKQNIHTTIDYLMNSELKTDKNLLLFLIRDILILTKLKPENLLFYTNIISSIENSDIDPDKILTNAILQYIKINSNRIGFNLTHSYKLLRQCYLNGLCKIDEIVDILKNCEFTEENYFILFSFFAQFIQRFQYLELLYKTSPKIAEKEKNIYGILEKKRFNQLNQFIEYGYEYKTLNLSIKTDDLESFKDFKNSQDETFDFNTNLEISAFEDKYIYDKTLPLVHFTAYYGAAKIFNFLTLNNDKINIFQYFQANKTSDINLTLQEYAVIGGNTEIIQFSEQNGADLSITLKYAAFYRRNDIFLHLLNTLSNIQHNNLQNEIVASICKACETNNIKACIKLLENYEIQSFYLINQSPYDYCLINESIECADILFNHNIEFNPLLLHKALDKRIDSMALKILESNKSNPNLIDDKGRSAFDIAAESCSFEVAKLLSEYPSHITTDILDKAYSNQNYNFLSVFADPSTYQETSSTKISSSNYFTFSSFYIFIFVFIMFIIIILLCYFV